MITDHTDHGPKLNHHSFFVAKTVSGGDMIMAYQTSFPAECWGHKWPEYET